jgi:hypothetical protein
LLDRHAVPPAGQRPLADAEMACRSEAWPFLPGEGEQAGRRETRSHRPARSLRRGPEGDHGGVARSARLIVRRAEFLAPGPHRVILPPLLPKLSPARVIIRKRLKEALADMANHFDGVTTTVNSGARCAPNSADILFALTAAPFPPLLRDSRSGAAPIKIPQTAWQRRRDRTLWHRRRTLDGSGGLGAPRCVVSQVRCPGASRCGNGLF